MILFIVGLFVGGILGLLLASLNFARRQADDAAEAMYRGRE